MKGRKKNRQQSNVARLARDEHFEREDRRNEIKRLRGHEKPASVPRTLRAKRTAAGNEQREDEA